MHPFCVMRSAFHDFNFRLMKKVSYLLFIAGVGIPGAIWLTGIQHDVPERGKKRHFDQWYGIIYDQHIRIKRGRSKQNQHRKEKMQKLKVILQGPEVTCPKTRDRDEEPRISCLRLFKETHRQSASTTDYGRRPSPPSPRLFPLLTLLLLPSNPRVAPPPSCTHS